MTSTPGAAVLAIPGLRCLAAGVKVLEKDDSIGVPSGFRIVQEGALHLLPYLTKRVLHASPEALKLLVEAKSLAIPVGDTAVGRGEPRAPAPAPEPEPDHGLPLALVELRDRLAALTPNGSCVVACGVEVGAAAGTAQTGARCAVVLMKYTDKAQLFISEGERVAMLEDLDKFHTVELPVDPPLTEQLAPLSTAELWARAARLRDEAPPSLAVDFSGREAALAAATRALTARPRAVRHMQGVDVPDALRSDLLIALQQLKWPPASMRPGVSADAYLVLGNRRGVLSAEEFGTRHPHYELRRACDALLAWYRVAAKDPEYRHTAIAVTRNFVASPHIDHFDRQPQLALALGDFSGGALCVESADGAAVDVVDTHNRIAKVDGRRIHWVRRFRGRDRFSLIFYNTEDDDPAVRR